MKKLTLVRWYCMEAVYLDGQLVLWHQKEHQEYGWEFLQVLGYQIEARLEVPTHDFDRWFPDKDRVGWWNPPKDLEVVKAQHARMVADQRASKITDLERQIAHLKAEDKK